MIASKHAKRCSASLVVLAALALWGVAGRSACAKEASIRAATSGVEVTTGGQLGTVRAIRGMTLEDGSELRGESVHDSVQLECSNGATQTLSGNRYGPFDAVIDNEDPKLGCTVNLKSGRAVATTAAGGSNGSKSGSAAIIGPGAVAMLSHHTQFGVSVTQRGQGGMVSAFVLDGAAVLERKDARTSRDVAAGSTVDTGTNSTHPIDDHSYEEIADTYATLDVSGRSAEGDKSLERELQQRWVDALEHSADPLARVRLAEEQAAVGATDSVIFHYELERAAQLSNKSGNKDLIERVQALRDQSAVGTQSTPDLPPAPAAARTQVATIRSATSGVEVIQDGQGATAGATSGMVLWSGFELRGESTDDSVQLECTNGATQTLSGKLSGPFDAVVDAVDPKRGCTVTLTSGTAVATTGNSGGYGGGAIIGPNSRVTISHGSQSGISVSQEGEAGATSAFVLDGTGVLEGKDTGTWRDVAAGSSVDTGTNGSNAIDDQSYEEIADAYATLDSIGTAAEHDQALEHELQQRWADALEHPGDPLARVELVEEQKAVGAAHSLIFHYELERATELANASGNQELIKRVQAVRDKLNLPSAPTLSVS